jgi:hypothetical protein
MVRVNISHGAYEAVMARMKVPNSLEHRRTGTVTQVEEQM